MVEVLSGVHKIDGVNANSYIVVEDDGSLTLIDAGMSKDGRKILNYLSENLLKKPSNLRTIILTHSHPDHVRGAFEIRKATGAKIAIHAEDADYLSGKKKMAPPKGAFRIVFWILGPFFKFTPLECDIKLGDSQNNRMGSLKVLHTPGHTSGSIALYDEMRKVVFVGDTIRYSKNGKLGGPPKAFTEDMKQAVESIEKISNLNFEVLLDGHGQPLKSKNAPRMVRELATSLSKGSAK